MSGVQSSVSIRWLCSFFEKSRIAYYRMVRRQTTVAVNAELIIEYVKVIRETQPRIGGRKLYHLLQSAFEISEIRCGRDKFFDVLRNRRLLIGRKRRYYHGTQSVPMSRRYPNLLIGLRIDRPEQVWVSDLTAIAIRDGGFAYLALITDAYSKNIMGFGVQRTKDRSCSLVALKMALARRSYPDQQTIHHSDGGGEFFNHDYLRILTKAHFQISCTAAASPHENAIAERINGIIKEELLLTETKRTFHETHKAIPKAVKIYNELRPHASCDYMTPRQAHGCSGPLHRRWSYKKINWRNANVTHIEANIEQELHQLGCAIQ